MEIIDYIALYWLFVKILLYVSAVIIALNSMDDLFIDMYYWTRRVYRKFFVLNRHKPLESKKLYNIEEKPIAIMLPAWQEADVIASMASLAASTFEYYNYHIFIGTYPNDPQTQEEVDKVASRYQNVHKVVTRDAGPTSKADCLNNVIEFIFDFEKKINKEFQAFVLHDAEDLIHPLELKLYNYLIDRKDLIQLPVIPLERSWYDFTSGHYQDEFAELHAKDMKVRESLSGFVPSAGVGTAFSRRAIAKLFELNGKIAFNTNSLTEDYDIGYQLLNAKMKLIFVRFPVKVQKTVKTFFGKIKVVDSIEYIAIREFFPNKFSLAIRQKSRWIIGIVFQGYETIGWPKKFILSYILYRDRKAVITNPTIFVAYFVMLNILFMEFYTGINDDAWWFPSFIPNESFLWYLLGLNGLFLFNRVLHRFYFTSELYGIWEGVLSFPRMIWGNIINLLALFRAISQVKSASKKKENPSWDKTAHEFPSQVQMRKRLGELLLQNGVIDEQSLQLALREQKNSNKSLGEILLGIKLIDEIDLAKNLSVQSDLNYLDLHKDAQTINMDLYDRFELLKLGVVFIRQEEKEYIVLQNNIFDFQINYLKEKFDKNVSLVIAKQSSIEQMLNQSIFSELSIDDMLLLQKVLRFKMMPKSVINEVIAISHSQQISIVKAAHKLGFLPSDQEKRLKEAM